MQDETQSTTRPSTALEHRTASTKPRENAFSPLYLERARHREAEPGPGESLVDSPLAQQAHWRGPWEVERVPAGTGWLHAATRRAEPARDGGGARLACLRRQDTLLGAAAFAALATPEPPGVNGEKPSGRRSPLGHPHPRRHPPPRPRQPRRRPGRGTTSSPTTTPSAASPPTRRGSPLPRSPRRRDPRDPRQSRHPPVGLT